MSTSADNLKDAEQSKREEDEDADIDHILDNLDNDLELAGYREQRLEQLKRQTETIRDLREIDHGKYTEVTDEKEVIRISAYEKRCVIHFYHRNFQRCAIMHAHLEKIAPKHFQTRFLRVFVENVPWLVEKLDIKVLPCLILFLDGIAKDRVIGFEELGNADDFQTSALELRLKLSGVLSHPNPLHTTLRTKNDDDDQSDDENDHESRRKIRNATHGKNKHDVDDEDDEFDL